MQRSAATETSSVSSSCLARLLLSWQPVCAVNKETNAAGFQRRRQQPLQGLQTGPELLNAPELILKHQLQVSLFLAQRQQTSPPTATEALTASVVSFICMF